MSWNKPSKTPSTFNKKVAQLPFSELISPVRLCFVTLLRAARAKESKAYRLDTLAGVGRDLWVRYRMDTSWVSFCEYDKNGMLVNVRQVMKIYNNTIAYVHGLQSEFRQTGHFGRRYALGPHDLLQDWFKLLHQIMSDTFFVDKKVRPTSREAIREAFRGT